MSDTGRIVARNSLAGIGGQVALKLLSFMFTIVIVRRLGPDEFGLYATALAFVGIFAVFSDMGMAGYAVREIARERGAVERLFGNMVVLRLILALGVIGFNAALALVLGYSPRLIALIALLSAGLLVYAVQGPTQVILQGFERFDYAALYNVIGQLAFIAGGLLVVWRGWGPEGLAVASCCATAVTALAALRTARRLTPLAFRLSVAAWLPLLRAGLPFCIITFATMLSFKSDIVMLALWRPAAEVGSYSVAYNLVFTLMILSSGFNSVLVPSLTRQYRQDPAGVSVFYLRAMRLLWTVSLPVAVGTTLLAGRIVPLLYGPGYDAATTALRILIWVLPVLTITSLCGAITSVLHRERSTARINAINAAFNIALNSWLIPRYGLLSAAVMTVATEVLGLTQYTLLLRDAFPLRQLGTVARAPLLATCLMGGAIVALWSLPLVVLIAVGGVIYGALLLASGGVSLDELRLIAGSIFAARRPAQKLKL